MVTTEIRRFARKHEDRLHHHDYVAAIQLLDNSELQRRLKEQNRLSWYHDHKTPNIRQCNTPTQLQIVPTKTDTRTVR